VDTLPLDAFLVGRFLRDFGLGLDLLTFAFGFGGTGGFPPGANLANGWSLAEGEGIRAIGRSPFCW
jgi:hypothetical protein